MAFFGHFCAKEHNCLPNVVNHSFGKQEGKTSYEALTLLVCLDTDIYQESIRIEKSVVMKDQC